MHHYRGKLFGGDHLQLDPANVFIQYHHLAGNQTSAWYGYLLVAAEDDVEQGETYTLRLEDGRHGDLRVDGVSPDDNGKFRANFVGEGVLE